MDDSAPRSDHDDAPGIRMRIGCRLKYRLTQSTPLIAMVNVHYSRFGDLERADYLVTSRIAMRTKCEFTATAHMSALARLAALQVPLHTKCSPPEAMKLMQRTIASDLPKVAQ